MKHALYLAYKYFIQKPLSTGLHVLLFTLGIGTIFLVIQLNKQSNRLIEQNIGNVDMVVGAKGSPMQIILSTLFQNDLPTGNILWSDFEKLKKNRLIAKAVPLAMGDSYQGFRVVGTDSNYFKLFDLKIASGRFFSKANEVVIGRLLAQALRLNIGDRFKSNHGFERGSDSHDRDLKVVGILEETMGVSNRLIFCDIKNYWKSHASGQPDSAVQKELTAILIKYKSPMGAVMLPRFINKRKGLQAASPAQEVTRLYRLLGLGFQTFKYLGMLFIVIAFLSVLITQLQLVEKRQADFYMLNVLGMSRFNRSMIPIFEGMLISMFGYLLAVIMVYFCFSMLANYESSLRVEIIWGVEEFWLYVGVLFVCVMGGVIGRSHGIYYRSQ